VLKEVELDLAQCLFFNLPTWNSGYQPVVQEDDELTFLGPLGSSYNVFARVNFGDNEARATLVHHNTAMWQETEVVVNESFKLFSSLHQRDTLVVQLRDQHVASSTHLGQVSFTHSQLQDILRGTTMATARRHVEIMLEAEAAMHHNDTSITQKMRRCGFRKYDLDQGGSIWLAFARLAESETPLQQSHFFC